MSEKLGIKEIGNMNIDGFTKASKALAQSTLSFSMMARALALNGISIQKINEATEAKAILELESLRLAKKMPITEYEAKDKILVATETLQRIGVRVDYVYASLCVHRAYMAGVAIEKYIDSLERIKNPYLVAEPKFLGELVSGVLTNKKIKPKSKAPNGMSPSYYYLMENNRKLKSRKLDFYVKQKMI